MIPPASVVVLAGSASRCMGRAFSDQIRVRYVASAGTDHLNPGLRSFRNLKASHDWRTALVEARTAGKNGGPPPA
jgi:hypothetical protein